jgi:hypothetical protein
LDILDHVFPGLILSHQSYRHRGTRARELNVSPLAAVLPGSERRALASGHNGTQQHQRKERD